MRSFDFAPLHRSTVGFDQIANLMDRVMANDAPQPSYPPYNIEKLDDDSYRISIAVAGFTEGDLSVEVREKSLIVAFERRFHLADHVQVTGAAHADGMLHIDLERQVPEALKPRQIQIARAPKAIEKDVVDANTVN